MKGSYWRQSSLPVYHLDPEGLVKFINLFSLKQKGHFLTSANSTKGFNFLTLKLNINYDLEFVITGASSSVGFGKI